MIMSMDHRHAHYQGTIIIRLLYLQVVVLSLNIRQVDELWLRDGLVRLAEHALLEQQLARMSFLQIQTKGPQKFMHSELKTFQIGLNVLPPSNPCMPMPHMTHAMHSPCPLLRS